jgi:general stress protein CsbA
MTQLLAAAGAVLPMAALTAWMYALRDSAPGLGEFFLGPLLFGGGMIFWLLFLHLVVCRDTPGSLGLGIGGRWKDIAAGILLGLAFLALKHLSDPLLAALFPPREPSNAIMQLIFGVARDPLLLALWLGPVVWIGVAGFEELWRAVVLRRLWAVFSGTSGRWVALLLVSALIGAAHGYQGPAAIVSIGFKSVLMGWYFMATGRVRTLIVAHAVYDSVQIVIAVMMIRAASA